MPKIKSKSTPKGHDKFPYPTIMEALCEVHFGLPEGKQWKSSYLGDLFKTVQEDFPIMEPVQQMGVSVEFGPQGFGQRLVPGQQKARYLHAKRKLLLQLSDSIFTVNRVEGYPGWKKMRRDIADGWQQAVSVLGPARITRIGLRYINRLPRNSCDQTPGYWLKTNEYIPSAILASQRGLLSRVQVQNSEQSRTIVTLADEPTPPDVPSNLIFDIDCIHIEEMEPTDKNLRTHIDDLHEEVWDVFSSAMTENLQRLLKTGKA